VNPACSGVFRSPSAGSSRRARRAIVNTFDHSTAAFAGWAAYDTAKGGIDALTTPRWSTARSASAPMPSPPARS
jgi:hypothetical protein